MKSQRKVIDRCAVARATSFAARRVSDYIKLGKNLEADSDRVERLRGSECKVCFYVSGRIGGAALTSSQCGICDKEVHSGNTNIDAICKDCAKRNKLCAHCGADLELRRSRRDFKFLETVAPTNTALGPDWRR